MPDAAHLALAVLVPLTGFVLAHILIRIPAVERRFARVFLALTDTLARLARSIRRSHR